MSTPQKKRPVTGWQRELVIRADRLIYRFSRHWLAIFNIVVAIYVSLPVLAPVLMSSGINGPARLIYSIYSPLCHQMASRSFFLGGEQYADFYARITATFVSILADEDWQNLAVFAHGGTNAAIIGWASGLGLSAFGVIDQATCCLNVLDFDVDANDGQLLRKTIRGMNITADDPAKGRRHSGDMESLARTLMRFAS